MVLFNLNLYPKLKTFNNSIQNKILQYYGLPAHIQYLIYNLSNYDNIIWPHSKQNYDQAKGFESSSEQSMSKQGNQENQIRGKKKKIWILLE